MSKDKWILRWESVHPLYRMDAFFVGHRHPAKVLGSDYGQLLGVMKENVMQMYYDQRDLDRKKGQSISLLSNKKKIEAYLSDAYENAELLVSELRDDLGRFENYSHKQKADVYQRAFLRLAHLLACYDLSRPEFFETIEVLVKNSLRKNGVAAEKINKLFGILTTSDEDTLLDIEAIDWLEIILSVRNPKKPFTKEVTRKLRKHQKKYGWIGASEQKNVWTLSHYKKTLKDDLADSRKKQSMRLFDLRKGKKSLKLKQKKIENKYHLNKRTLYFFHLSRKLSNLRMSLRLKWVESGPLFKQLYKKVGKEYYVPESDLESYLHKEMRKLFLSRKKVSYQCIQERKNFVFKLKKEKNFTTRVKRRKKWRIKIYPNQIIPMF